MSNDTRWGPDFTWRDHMVRARMSRGEPALDYRPFIVDQMERGEQQHAYMYMLEYAYERYGRPKWFVDTETFDLVQSLKTDNDLSGIFMPHDVFKLIFERGTMLMDKPLRSIFVGCFKSDLTREFIRELMQIPVEIPLFDAGNLFLKIDYGLQHGTKHNSWDTPVHQTGCFTMLRPPKKTGMERISTHRDGQDVTEEEFNWGSEYEDKIGKLIAACLLYAAARPDCVLPYRLPRSCRRDYKGNPAVYRRMLAPKPPLREAGERSAVEPTGRKVRGYYRGWVLATLRDKRWKRNPDGSFKVVLRQPCAVNGGYSAEEIAQLA